MAAQYFGQRFRAAIAYYPRCVVVTVPAMTAPVLVLIGGADQWNGADACKTSRNLARAETRTPYSLPVPPGARIVNLAARGMLFVSVAQQLGSGNSFARLLCCPLSSQAGRKKAGAPRIKSYEIAACP